MGYRAHTVTVEREYGNAAFCDWDKFYYEFLPNLDKAGVSVAPNETMDYFEVDKSELKKYTESLTYKMIQGEPANIPSDYPGMSIGELEAVLADSIKEAPGELVIWEWF